jgi:hypothetical protein
MIATPVSPTASQATGASTSRVVSIDIFRGLTMAVMIFVNAVAEVRGLMRGFESTGRGKLVKPGCV